ncbi:peptidase M76 family-domain-containing protein [Xylariaceae sp. FL0594]|nr:peptidase M76 family-domain-containing protein [Xylariaceae sp. FL0594]
MASQPPTPPASEAPSTPQQQTSTSTSIPTSTSTSTPPATGPDGFPAILRNDPKRTGFDPNTNRWINYFKILTGSITDEGVFHYRESISKADEARDCRRCEDYRDWALRHSPTVRFLRERIAELGGSLDRSNIVCARCPARLTEDGKVHRQAGGFDPGTGILICSNEVRDRGHLEDSLAHEMVHAWDHLRWKMDWVGDKDLKHAACTEIRASMLSGECRWTRESMTRGNLKLTQQFQECVRRRAILSVMARPRCKDDVQAAKVVNQVWDSCFSDTRPFDDVYR